MQGLIYRAGVAMKKAVASLLNELEVLGHLAESRASEILPEGRALLRPMYTIKV